ncbi:LPD38 domain-containing protein [Phocaeicola vulgatus]|uniref:LPD38 domain-containing protein n=1 Tax=Phocaeicola vulgatus TaxID=821 RepID=UPI00216B287A|nr:LPD38 domain-containing protein [Phocaeicola vulgatus]
MPIFEYNGKKYNVRDEHIDSFMKDFPDASTIMEREGKKYRVKSADYRTFMSEQQQPEQPALDSTPETPVTPSAEEMPLTEQDKIRFSANIGQMKRRTEQMIDGFNERMETMREYHENAPLGGGQTAEGKMQFNPESGKLEKTYITPLGNRYTSKGLADMESFRYRQAADMSVNGQLRRAMLKLAELQEKREASAKRVHEQWEEDTKKNTAPLGFLLAADTYVPRQMSDKENSTLDVAIRQTEELIKDLEEQKDREQGVDVGFWRGFGRVAGDFRTWDFGMSDMRDALTMMNADDLKGENATEGEREAYNEMMGALYNKGQAEQMYGGNAGFWNRAGMMTGHMPAFMLDFGITGGGFKGINVLSKAGTKAATKVVGKETVEQMAKQGFKTYVKDNGVKGLGQYATNWTIKALGTTADDLLLRAPLMTNTVQAGKTTADIIDRKLGDVVVDENGNYDFSNDKTWGNAIWQGEANAIVENYSEMFGSHLDPVVTLGNMSKLANVVGAKRIGAVLSKTDAGALDGIMGQTHQLFNKMGVSDYFGEVTEEYYGQLWRTMLNLDDAYQQNPDGTRTNLLATGQFHGDIWGGMALSMGLMGAGKATLSGVQYASMKHGVNKADARATELLGKEIWEPLRATIDLTTNDDIGSVAEGIVNDKDFSDDERAAILTYMERSLMMRGFNLGTLAQKRGGEQDEDVQSMNESYIDGYNLADPQEMTDAKNMRDYQRQRVSAIVDENTLGFLDIHPMNALEEMRNNGLWGESELETVIDYLNAKQVYDGMIQRVRDDIDARVEQSNAMVDARTNRTSGMIQGATMKQDDRRVYVVGGNLVQYADGSGIDNRASDGSIIVRDAETGALEQVSPDAVLNIDEPLNPSDEKMTAEEVIIQQFAQEASDKIDGVVTFNPGDTYTITGDDAQIQVQIVANEDGIVDNGDGTVNVSDGVNIFPLAKETIQQQADAANLARVAQFEQQRTIENAERKQEMQEAERPQYALNDIVSLTDENGVTVRGNITADADADGKYEVFTEAPINGKRVNLFTRDELDNMLLEHNGVAFEHPAENESNNGAENIPENDNNAPQNIPAMQRIPKDEQGNPLYEQADSDTAWDAIVEQTEGDEDMAQTVADGMVADKEEALKKLEKAKSKGGNSIAEKIASEKERKAAIDAAKQDLLAWQKIAGNYKKGHVQVGTFNITIENPKGSVRSGIDTEGNKWETIMQNTYGYIRGTEGVDGDHIDVFLSDDIDGWNGRRVFVVDQYNEDGSFDEHKVMLGFNETDDAEAAYFANYDSDWANNHKTVVTAVNLEDFKKWIDSSHRKTKAFAEYKSVKSVEEQSSSTQVDRLSEIKSRIEELHKEQEAAHGQSDIFEEARIISEINDLFTEQRKLEQNNSNEETTTPTDAAYTITQAQYTTKRGKVLDMHLVKFNNKLRDTVRKHTTMFAKQLKGWWDKEKQGFMMRSKEDAERLAEYATDAQSQPPLSLSDLLEVNDGNVQFAESQLLETSKQEEKQEYSPVWQYSVSVDKETGLTTLKRDDVSGPIPIGDGRFNYTANSPEEMLEIVRNPKNFNQELRDAVETILENKVKIREIVRTEKAEATEQESKPENNPSGNRLVTDERYAELRERMRKKLLGQMNMGIDPEILAIGTEMAVYHLEKGARKFTEYATAMVADLGDSIRPYLKAFYNGARDLPEVAENGLDADMTPYDEVQQFDVANFDKKSIDALATAETVTRETEVEQEAEIAQERIKKSRPARKKNEKKAVISQQSNELGLFDALTDNNKNSEHGLQRTDAERSERVPAKGYRHEQGLSRGTETGSESEQQAGRGTDNEGERTGDAVDRTVRPRLSDSLNEQSIEGKRKKEIEKNRKLADELKGVTLHLNDKLGGEHEISGIVYYELANVFHCNDNISGPFQATRKELDAILKVARKNDGRNTFTPKNTHNNHSERGKDHAPTSVDARIEANIKAIELAKQLLESGEQATEKQMQTLRKFSGWGGLGKAFNEGTSYAPNPIAKKLRELLGEKAYQEAVMSANSAYYTPAYVVDTLWDIAEQMGFNGGNILEGSAGIGNILGQMPTNISERSDIHAIEIDRTSGGILSLLYPDAKVEIQGFEQTRIPNGSVDLAITNVPFVTGLRVNDTTGDKDLSKKFHNIHDFCIAKNVRKLREGGLGIFITSNGTLDNSKKLRDWIVNEGGSDFVGAFRMHNKTFGGTGVTSDIVVIRKRVNGQKSAHVIDVSDVSGERMAEYDTGETRKVKGKETPVIKQLSMDYNRYFIEHPENMAGEMHFAFEKGDTFRPTSKGLYPAQDKKQEQMLSEFVHSFKAEEFGERNAGPVTDVMPDKKIGEIFVRDGKLFINSTASAQPLEVNANKVKGHTKVECFEAYTAIKEALAEVLSYQTENESDEGLKPLLDKLNKAYDDFVGTYGHFNKNTAIAFLRNDVDYANVFALEKFEETADEKGNRIQKFEKTDVFSKRVVEKDKEPTPANVKDGIIASIFKFGRVDIPYIAEQLGTGIEDVKKEIIESGYGFEDPVSRQMEASYQYLSGNIREKLRQAEENNENGEFDRNIKALQEVMPMEIPAHLIDFTLGSSWIDPKLYEDFVKERTEVDVRFTAVGGTWFMKEPYFTNYEKNRAMGVTSEMLGRTIMGHTLIEAAIQNRSITVSTTKKHYDGTTETITDKEATQACAAKIDEIRQDFKDWARQKMQSDPEMSERMERIYNDMFNNFVPMSIPDEFVPEYFGGASHKFKMRPHQGRAIVRGTQQPLLLAHEVGTGKTFTLISTAMEMRRLGTARKPMIVVQNATVGQFVASAKELYPNAKILTLEEADRSAEGRKNFYAKIRYNDWDMIVVPQSTFEFIPDSEEREMTFVQDKIEEKMLILEQMKEEDPDGKNMITRQAEREIELLEEQLAGLADNASKKRTANDEKKRAVALQNAEVKAMEMLDRRTDDVENFDDMGIDALLVDEAHEYKHLGFATAMQRGVKGVDPSYSKKSQGVFLKTQAVLEKNNGRNVIFATGTPISNTAAEIWTFMRYLMPADTMKEYGIYYFDDFVRNFGNIQQMLEFTTSGKFKENNRFAGYVNLPELVRIWSGVSDTVLTKEAGGVKDKIPEMEGGKAQDLYLPQTRALRSIMKFVKSELEHYEQMSGKEKKENSHIPLTMYGIAKAAAVDARLVQSDAEDDQNSKTNEAVRQTLRSLKETADYKGTVAIFADNYQNKQSGFNLYDDIRNKLIAEGVPADEIVVMRSGMTVKKKLEIFEKVNRGEVRVILGSTFTLGTGVNIQERLHTLIHLDAPNRPMDYTQRNGRILRQGNLHKDMNKPVRILRFGVEDSLDVTAYQRLKTKGAIADSIMNGKQMMNNSMTNRVLEEEEDVFGDTVAQLSGSEYAMLKNNAEKNVRKYASRKKQWETDQTYIHNAKPRLKAFIKDAEKRIEDNGRYLEAVRSLFPDGQFKEIVTGKHRFASVDTMDDFFKEHNKSILAEMKQMKDGEISGEQKRELIIQIGDFSFVVTTKLTRKTMSDGATLFNDVERRMTYSCLELGIEDVPVRQNLLRNAIEDITDNVITGKDFAERLSAGERSKKHNEAELKELLSREGKPFEYEEELAQAKAQLEEYAELMKKELEEKEAKYAEMDASVETANDITNTDEDDVLYRSDDTMYRIREDAAPKNTGIGYKVFVLKNGELYPPMVANPNGEATPVGVWLDADAAPIAGQSKTGRNQVKAGGKGTQGGSGKLAYRPGWHLGVIPYALQFNRIDENGDKTLFPANFVWAEVEYANDVDYQEEAMSYGYNKNGKFQHSYAGLPRIPENGAYTYRTNPNPETDPWIITGAMRVKRLLTPSEVDEMVKEAGREPQRRQENAVTDAEIAALNAEIANDYRNGIGTYTDDEVSYENDSVAKLLGQSRRTAKQRREFAQRERQRMAERVESLAEKLHLDNVEVVTDASVLDGKKQHAKGFYSKSTGKITIVIPNHTSTFDVEQTLLHEAVAHYGLRQLFGEHFDTFLDNVFNNADENIRRHIVDMAAKNGWNFHKATEEYLASLAEDTEFENINASWWQQIKDFFLNMLHKIGFEDFRGVTLSDNELRYILWRSYENLAEPGRYRNILGEAADVAKQYELKVGNYAVSDPHHQTVAESDDALYRTGDPEIHERELARDRYERRVKSGMFQSQEALQDSMLGLKEAMTAILGKETNIEDVDGFENAYLGENRLSSVNKAEADAFAHTLFKPMLDEVAKLARTEAEREELTDYMMAKHGLERNTYMRNEAINNGATDADQTDYAGLTALTGMDNVADAETEAQIMVNDYEQAHDTTDLWKKVNAASKAILSKSYECGMMSKATFDKISDMYDFYIPLRGFDEKTSSEAYAYLTHKQSAFNAPIKKAEGRRSKADDPFANLQSMAEGAIMQGNRNKLVKQRFLNFALNHPSDLVSVSDIWVEYDTVADEWKPVFPDNIDSTDTPEVVERKMLDFETKMESLAQQYPDRYKHGKDTVNIPYRIVESRDMRQHQIVVKRGGRDYVITINGNPRAAQALNGQTNPDNDMSGAIGAILRAGENINRQLSAFYTTRNPDFIVSNFMRDMLYTNTMTWIRESPNYALRFHRNYMYANPVRIKQLLAKHRKGTLDMSNKTEAMFHQFMMNGGETGYANIRDIEQHKNDIRRELKKSNGKIPVKKAWDLLGERFDEYNRAVENCARFAAFMTSREMGRSIDRAIYDAKEISVNFNKKGSGAKFYDSTGQTKAGNASALVSGLGRSGYVFWNAAIQGTANFGRQMKRHPAKAFTGIAAMFLLGAIVAYLGGDDDDDDDKNAYYNLPEYVRRSNILFRAGNSWVSIPLPVEYRAVYGMGELMISVLNGKEHLTDGEIAEAITGQATQILPIDFLEGGGGLNAFVPSAYKPLWEAYVAEKSWTGMPLYKDTPYNKDMPEWTKAYKSANKYIVGLANAMNEATGGDPYTKGTIDFNPAKIEYMLNGYFGGVFGTIDKLSKMVETVTGNREYDPRSFLLANRLVKAGDERTEYRAVNNEYFRLKEEHDRLKSRLKHYEEDTDNDIFDYAEKIDFLYNSPEYERYEIFEDYREDIDDLYNELKEAISDEERKDIEAELNELKKEMIEEMNKTRK